MRTDWAGLIDAWAVRFFSELDYLKEAATADVFRQQMAKLQGIIVPGVYSDLTTRVVLVTEWVEGEPQPATVLLYGSVRGLLCFSIASNAGDARMCLSLQARSSASPMRRMSGSCATRC